MFLLLVPQLRRLARLKPVLLGGLTAAIALSATAASEPRQAQADDLLQMSLEQLLDVEVVSASKYGQSMSEAPASMTVVTADDIRTFGYRTLADALSSVRGFYITTDHIYRYAGVRGFSPPGDYNDRLLVMVDGHRINENIYDTGFLGTDFPVDMDLVERIEVIRGPGSSLYGSNALLGVVNVVTKKGEALGGVEGLLAVGRNNLDKERLSWGRKLENGADVLMSASRLRTPGGDLSFPDAGLPNGGRTSGTDFDHNASLFGKFALDGLTLEGAWSRRDKGNPAALTGTVFNDPSSYLRDEMAFVDARYRTRLSESAEVEGRMFVGTYDYQGNYLYPPASGIGDNTLNLDMAHGRWWGGEFKLLKDLGAHRMTLGLEYQDNWRQAQINHDAASADLNVNEVHSSRRSGVYAQDDYRFSDALTLSAGLRHDTNSGAEALTSPRLAAVWRAAPASVVKLLYGSAFRVPNNYELFYSYPGQQAANPALRPERISTWESTLDHYLNPDLRLTLAAYQYKMHDQITQVTDIATGLLQYQNQGDITGRGFELEAEQQFGNGGRLRGSLGWEKVRDATDQSLQNSPRRLAKLNYSWPLAFGWRLGLEGQAVSERMAMSAAGNAGRVPGYGLVNLTLLRPMTAEGWEVSLAARNLFNRRVLEPAAGDVAFPDRTTIPGDGLDWRVKLLRRF